MPFMVHHEAHEDTKKGKVKSGCTTEDTEITEKGRIRVEQFADGRVGYEHVHRQHTPDAKKPKH